MGIVNQGQWEFNKPNAINYDRLAQVAAQQSLVTITAVDFDTIINDINTLEANWNTESKEVLNKAGGLFKLAAQQRSPYLYGVLHGAHFNEMAEDRGQPAAIVSISHIYHHILGGYADKYGPRIHGEGRPWFGITITQEASRIMDEIESDYKLIFRNTLKGTNLRGSY